MKPGRKPATVETKLSRGTYRPDRDANKVQVVVPSDPPRIPDPVAVDEEGSPLPTLTPQAWVVWNETLPRAMNVGVTEADSAILSRYCSMEAISREQLSKGHPVPAAVMGCLRQMEELLGIAGPKSRVGRAIVGKSTNPFERHRRR